LRAHATARVCGSQAILPGTDAKGIERYAAEISGAGPRPPGAVKRP
jgi:hypothetical protein